MPNPTRAEVIKNFLIQNTHGDLANLYNVNMECQVNVAQDGGERIGGEFKGKKWNGWTDGLTTWKSFRIPHNAATQPEYTDSEIKFDLAAHVEAIGLTGWDWKNKVSRWVAFDFDSLIAHKKTGLTNAELEDVRKVAFQIPWVTIRKSTSGSGYHLYVLLSNIPTQNHNEHAALARAILGKLAALTGYDFQSKVDAAGGNMWVWHRKIRASAGQGLQLIKLGETLSEVPPNWKDHIKVITGQRRKNLPQNIERDGHADQFEEVSGSMHHVKLDSEHQNLINWLKDHDALWWWDQDHHMLVTHTHYLKQAHEDLKFRGLFETTSPATDLNTQNVFGFPLRNGAWVFRRYTLGIQEHESWDQDSAGWTRCFFNKDLDIATACKSFGGLEDPAGGFIFREAEMAQKAAKYLGVIVTIPPYALMRETKLRQHKDGRLLIEIKREPADRADLMEGWLAKGNKPWTRIFNAHVTLIEEPETCSYDDLLRHLVTESGEDYGWKIKTEGQWRAEPLSHVKVALGSLGLNAKDITKILGSSVFKCWTMVNKPFQPEYTGDREWNLNSAQLKYSPTVNLENLYYPTWLKILTHCGVGLDDAIKSNAWCKANGITSGADYLKCWIASVFQEPLQPLPYLFFWGDQDCGKSIFHEALSLLVTRGYQRADIALSSKSDFNGELEGAVFCVVEEVDLNHNRTAYNRIKDWVTSRELLIRALYKTPYHIPNSTHWISCANDHTSCPIFTGDTRITMIHVDLLDPAEMIPKKKIIPLLEKEAPDFLAEILGLEIPESDSRLNVPVIETQDKIATQQLNQTDLEVFIEDKCKVCNGQTMLFKEFYDAYIEWLDPNEIHRWSKIKTSRSVPPKFPKGKIKGDGQLYIGNITWKENTAESGRKLIIRDGYLEPSALL